MRLVLVELNRFRLRRAVALMLLAAALLTALIAATTLWDTRPLAAADVARAERLAAEEAASPMFQKELARCERRPQEYLGPQATPEQCSESMMPRADWYLDRPQLALDRVSQDAGVGALMLVAALMVVIGTTFAGADWATGSLSNQLLFEPRRSRVWLAKGAAVLLGTLVASTVIMTGFWAAMFVAAEMRDISTGATVQEEIRWMVGRGVLLAALGATGAYALTMLLRHTVGTIAVLFAYAVGGTAIIAALPITGVGRWSVGNNVLAWLNDGYEYYDQTLPCGPRSCDQVIQMTLGQGASYLGVVLALVALASVIVFRRRDVP
jgi:hypothetical protein